MKQKGPDLRWGIEQRLEFIEFRLFWEGGINRADLMRRFGVSVPQASQDLSRYQELAPRNIVYDRSRKRYIKSAKFSPQFMQLDSDRYLSQLRSVADGLLSAGESWLGEIPSLDSIRLPHRNVQVEILRPILTAVREQKALEVRYQSLTNWRSGTDWFWISPHAFAFDGTRWHVRSFVHEDHQFADFLLPRFLQTRNYAEAITTSSDDLIWNETVHVELKPHPKLNDEQKRVVAADFGMKNARLSVTVRLALLYYFLRRLNLDFNEESRLPHEQHVVLANPSRVKQLLERAQLV